MALQILGAAAVVLTLTAILYLAVCWMEAKRSRKPIHFEVTKSGKTAVLMQGLALAIGVGLVSLRDYPSGIVVPVFWLLFPIMVLVSIAAVIVGGRDLRSLYRAMNVFAVGAGTITLVSIAVWILLPRLLYR